MSYTTAEAIHTTSRVELIDNKEYAKVTIDENSETLVMYMSALDIAESSTYPSKAVQIANMWWDRAPTNIPGKYLDYANVFSLELSINLPVNTSINEHTIKLIEGKQQPYGPNDTLSPVELEILKAYIKTHLKSSFI